LSGKEEIKSVKEDILGKFLTRNKKTKKNKNQKNSEVGRGAGRGVCKIFDP